jgi:hypothetical protein
MLIGTKSIHTMGMRFPIDVLMLDNGNRCLLARENVQPGRVVFGPSGVVSTIEMPVGTLRRHGLLERQGKFILNPRIEGG